MNREEAIEELKTRYLTMSQRLDKEELHKANKAIDMAIKALSQEQQSEWERDHEILKAYADGQESMEGDKRNIEEIAEVMKCDADADTKCRMISNILNAKPHYFKSQEPCDKYIKEIDHLRKYIYKLETQIVEQEPCEDAISRQQCIDAVNKILAQYVPKIYLYTLPLELEKAITDLPSVSTEKTGRWIMPVQDDGMSDPIYYQVRCSECGFDLDPQTWHQELHQYGADKYCPKCGTFLGGDNNGNE